MLPEKGQKKGQIFILETDFLVPANSSHIGPKPWLNLFGNSFAPVFGAEDYMQMILGKCVRHLGVALPGLHIISSSLPRAYAPGLNNQGRRI
jgi:hypothetical protein